MKQTKRPLSALLTFCLLLGLFPTTARAADMIEISTLDQLEQFRDEVNSGSVDHSKDLIELTADIDLGGSAANQWTPIGTESNPFKGIFDGGGHRITGLYISTTNDYSCQGLFGYVGVGGMIKKLGVEGTVKGGGYSSISGGVVGCNVGTVEYCYHVGSVAGLGSTTLAGAGGVVGENGVETKFDDVSGQEKVLGRGTVRCCYQIGEVSGSGGAGGVVEANWGIVENCYNIGSVRNIVSNSAGGIVGNNLNVDGVNDCAGTVTNCYNIGNVAGSGNSVGGVAGSNSNYGGMVTSCYFLTGKATTGIGQGSGSATSITTEGFKVQTTFTGWDFSRVWKMSQALGRPILINNPEPEPHIHAWDTEWSTDETGHWHECTAEGCDVTENSGKYGYAAHSGGKATCTDKAVCTTCGQSYGELDAHTWGGTYEKDASQHWKKCTVCQTETAKENHTGGTATCTAMAVCGECKQEYGSLNSSNHANLTHNNSVAATCTAYGVKEYWTCSGCGKYFSDASGTTEIADLNTWKSGEGQIAKVSHSFAGNYLSDENGHWRKCEKCDATDTKANHDWESDTDTTCDTCNYTRTISAIDGKVDVGENAPKVDVAEETLKKLAGSPQTGETVTVTLTVEKKDDLAEGASEIKNMATGKTVEFLDLSLVKEVSGGSNPGTEKIKDTQNNVLEIVVTYAFSGKKDVTVYRKHGTEDAAALDELTSIPDTPADGKFYADSAGGRLYIYATKFSTYAIGYTPEGGGGNSGNGGGNSGGGSSSGGGWSGGGSSSGGGGSVTDKPAPGGASSCLRDKTCPVLPYTDASVSAWYHDGIHYCVQNGLMVGTDSTRFSPHMTTSRAMIAAILWRLEGEPKAEAVQPFSDVADDRWYTQAIAWAAEAGVVKGYGEGRFGPNDPITREQLASLLWRYAGNPAAADLPLSFTDAGEASGYAQDALRWAVDQGILTGKGGGVLDPRGMATRAEAAQMLMRFCLSRK